MGWNLAQSLWTFLLLFILFPTYLFSASFKFKFCDQICEKKEWMQLESPTSIDLPTSKLTDHEIRVRNEMALRLSWQCHITYDLQTAKVRPRLQSRGREQSAFILRDDEMHDINRSFVPYAIKMSGTVKISKIVRLPSIIWYWQFYTTVRLLIFLSRGMARFHGKIGKRYDVGLYSS